MTSHIPKEWYYGAGKQCPECSYVRQEHEKAPKWQCPQCGIIYAKVENPHMHAPRVSSSMRSQQRKHALRVIQDPLLIFFARMFDLILIISLLIFLLSWWYKDRLPNANEISPLLLREPEQTVTQHRTFVFNYLGDNITVEPVANYKLWGIIASQNDVDNFFWGYEKDNVNIKDICVLYGDNLSNDQFPLWKIWNKQWTCFIDFPGNSYTAFNPRQLSNNHLIAQDEAIRQRIQQLRVGDQIYIQGMLVNYQSKHAPYWRRSSKTRDDAGNGACEVLYVEKMEILKQSNETWYYLYEFSSWTLITIFCARLLILLIAIYRQKTA
ncbi:MAG: hypothetical protein KIT27_03575 [Legionellales bacterium]|nr:hypothetical protein [Legionellales bacterium]